MNKYRIKLIGYHAFGGEEAIVEAKTDREAIDKAEELYPQAESYIVVDIENGLLAETGSPYTK